MIKVNFLILLTILFVGCSSSTEADSQSDEEVISKEQTEDLDEKSEDSKKSNKDHVDEKVSLTEKELKEKLKENPLKVIDKDYIVQDEELKSLYPDMLEVIIENNSGEDIRDAVIAFAAWDENGLPLKIEASFELSGGNYIYIVNANDINLIDGDTYGEESGFEVSEEMEKIEEFEATVVSYETFDDEKWENEFFDDFQELYEGKKRSLD